MKIGTDLLWFSDRDVQSLLSMEEALACVEEAFALKGKGEVQLPPKVYLTFEPFGGDLRAMPGYLRGNIKSAGVKIINSNAGNPDRGLPAVTGLMLLIDPPTGLPVAIMAAQSLTNIRTGAGGGVAAKYLARRNSSTVGLLGCGQQALTQLAALAKIFSLKKVKVWGKTAQEAETFVEKAQAQFRVNYEVEPTIPGVCEVDILVTTTPVRDPLVKAAWIRPGTHVNAIGADAPGKQELEVSFLPQAKVYVDDWAQASHAGEINNAVRAGKFARSDLAGELGDVIAGKSPGRENDSEITLFDSTGLAIQDISVAHALYEKGKKEKRGQIIKFYG